MKLDVRGHQWTNKKLVVSILWGILFLAISLMANYWAGIFATNHESNPVSDLILDHIPTFDVDGIFIYGIILFFIFVIGLLCLCPRRMPFVLKSFSLFIVVRSFFVILTHLGPAPHETPMDTASFILNTFTFTGDLFFSGHTGLPFLMALVFWDDKVLRWVFLATTVFFAVIVLLGHLHYSIDVFAAFFITYGVTKISERLFKNDFNLFHSATNRCP
jgi:PAP2 superfamily C-terminal